MTTDGHGLTDAECDAIRRALPREVVLTESRHEYECGLIRAAFAAGRASVPWPESDHVQGASTDYHSGWRDGVQAVHDAATGVTK